jgi:hypothetical protein
MVDVSLVPLGRFAVAGIAGGGLERCAQTSITKSIIHTTKQ